MNLGKDVLGLMTAVDVSNNEVSAVESFYKFFS